VIERFEGESGFQHLIEALLNQKLVGGDVTLAQELSKVGTLLQVESNTRIIEQDAEDTDLYLILAGSFDIVVNGRKVGRRFANDHVGEMAAILPAQLRSATVVATQKSVVLKVPELQFRDLTRHFPDVWRSLARELARRLEQRNAHVTATHEKITIFIVSSTEALEIARTIQDALSYDFNVVLWTDGVFRISCYPLESLEKQLDNSDFAIAIVQPDDNTESRGKSAATPRDNVIFELGLFIGRIGRQRSFLVEPRGEEVKLPSDLAGIITLPYKNPAENLESALAPVANRIRKIAKELGPNN
jgi:predicted nucleotide-binding protein